MRAPPVPIFSWRALAGVCVCLGCAARAEGPSPATPAAAPPPPPPHGDETAAPGVDPLLGIARPFSGRRLMDDTELSGAELLDALALADLVCVGERHDQAVDHWAELAVVYGLARRAELSGRSLGLGMEMWEAHAQPSLDGFATGKLTEAELLAGVEWERRWGYDYAFYRPTVDFTRSVGGGLLGLNARRETVRRVARRGLDALDKETARQLPELELHDAEHRATFDAAIGEHPGHHDPERMYTAQVLRDETMAATAATWLAAHQPARQLVVLAGVEHCRDSAIPARVGRRLKEAETVAVRPLTAKAPTDAESLAGYDYVFVLGEPE